jgi:hypothetical protein
MRNSYTAETPVEIAGKTLVMQFDWRALGAVKTAFGGAALGDLIRGDDPEALAKMLAIGLAKRHPEWTVERILDASPPVMPVVDAITIALNAAYYGPSGPPKGVTQNPLRRIARKMLSAIRWFRPSGSRTAAE